MSPADIAADTTAPGRVAYQGAPGAFSHEACLALRPWDEAVAFETFEAAIQAVRDGDCQLGLIPVENTTVGVVEPAASLVAASGLTVLTEVWRPIRLALMAVEGARLSDIRTVESHPVALAQCQSCLASMGLTVSQAFDTAGAAREVALSGDRSRGALAPVGAAEVYGLSILRNDLQDSTDNRTRFVLVGPADA